MLWAWRAVRTNILDTTNIVNFSRIVKRNTKKNHTSLYVYIFRSNRKEMEWKLYT